jgi:hypothetical protein
MKRTRPSASRLVSGSPYNLNLMFMSLERNIAVLLFGHGVDLGFEHPE